ncbi:GGDEF domain-containing protein [Fictibacillus sp. KIGAM418]|uniref:GGDEF domain-containing protein n=1 Tax=Fictibacillus marinisediminis TaxID=2878389 RepID=A0A9X1X9G4_9BACL|nr:GGDEF domain-containing protein [Fictibacillus marinisediminis]MCK6256667.1 GGDEF domain-containing protein [Fictibacillus marinisediminis]
MPETDIADLKSRLYNLHIESIPSIIERHLLHLEKNELFVPFLAYTDSEYQMHLKWMLTALIKGIFIHNEEFNSCMERIEDRGFKQGHDFAGQRAIPHQLLPLLAKSLRQAGNSVIQNLIKEETAENKLFFLERWGHAANSLMIGVLSGYFSKQVTDLKELSIRDPLTNLYNRRYFYHCLETEVLKAKRGQYPLSLIMMDINDFKEINDQFGHHMGDELLQQIAFFAEKLQMDLGFRFGGDEFVFLIPGHTEQTAYQLAGQIDLYLRSWNEKVSLAYGTIRLHADAVDNIDHYLRLADERMYMNKRDIKQ